jgi:hypothetical protein
MNKYHIIVYFSNNINFETNIESSLDLNEFTDETSKKFDAKDNIFIQFIGNDIKYCINRNNVLFYTIEKMMSKDDN